MGENDNDPNHPQIDQSNTATSVQGADRVERSVNAFAAAVTEASQRNIPPTQFELEIFVAADDAHSWGEDDLPQIYEFLFRSRSLTDLPVRVHPRGGLTPSSVERSQTLPQNVAQLDAGQQFYVEFWVEAPSGGTADNGTDYQGLSGTLVILAGQNSASIMVTPIDDAESEGTETVVLTLSPDPGYSVGFPSNGRVTIDDEPIDVQDRAVTDNSIEGTLVSGDFYSTYSSDNTYEGIREELYGEKKRSRLLQQWTFDVTGGSTVTFFVEAWHDSTAEDFWFEYSTDQSTWASMLTIMGNADADAAQSYSLPPSLNGLVYVRVVDTDRTRGESSADTIFIDDMFIRSQS